MQSLIPVKVIYQVGHANAAPDHLRGVGGSDPLPGGPDLGGAFHPLPQPLLQPVNLLVEVKHQVRLVGYLQS